MTREEALKQLYALAVPAARSDVAGGAESATAVLQREVVQVTGPASAPAAAPSPQTSRIGDQLSVITAQLDQLRNAQQTQSDALAENTKAIAQSMASKVGQAAASTASGFLGGFGLSPIVSGLLKLFGGGGGGSESPAAPVKYSPPAAVQLSAGLSGGQLTEAGYGSGDRVRPMPQVTVQVQAMDSRSFMDRSDDIARAVRQAMLESHAINDVVQEL